MATKKITFDPDSGVPSGINLTMYGGSDFNVNFDIVTTSNSAYDLTGYSGSAAMSKSVAIGATLGITSSFTVGFTSAYDGKLKISLSETNTRGNKEGRYVFDILVGKGGTTYALASGNILVVNPVASAI